MSDYLYKSVKISALNKKYEGVVTNVYNKFIELDNYLLINIDKIDIIKCI